MPTPFGFPQAGDIATPPLYSARASYTANVASLTAASTTCDGVTLVEGNLVLLTEQNTSAENGLYEVGGVAGGVAPLVRFEKAKVNPGLPSGTQVFVSEGSARGGKLYALTAANPIVIGTTSLTFVELANPAKAVALKLAVTKDTADAAVLYTVPTGKRLFVEQAFWEVTANWTGGSSSTIGLSSSSTLFATKGDIQGGASGDAAAALTTTIKFCKGTQGAKLATNGKVVLEAGETIIFDRITSAFTAGTGYAHIVGTLVG